VYLYIGYAANNPFELKMSRRVSPPSNVPSPAEALAEASARLLRSAEGTMGGALPLHSQDAAPAEISEFVQVYRQWIILERSELGTQQQQADQWQMLVHCMVNAATIDDAIAQLLHFAPVVWKQRAPGGLRHDGDTAALLFNEPRRAGAEGLVAVIWMQSLILGTLEFLANAQFPGVSGCVRHDNILPEGVARLLFGAPIAYGQEVAALLIPRQHLRRPVVARATDLQRFFRQLLPLTLGAARAMPEMQAMVAGLIRDYKHGPDYRDVSRAHVAAMLGVSEATMRRRLAREGVTYRQIKDAVYDKLAREWLDKGDVPVGTIATRLGFSDAFAFRRFFVRRNKLTPTAYRHSG
jgi:AraC-like DNA-binding protein